MRAAEKLQHGAVGPGSVSGSPDLSERQAAVLALVQAYYGLSHELPSSGWLARRLTISPERARQHLGVLRRRGWLDRSRLEKR